jgi:hypothetical protein
VLVGVRANSARLDAALREVLADHVLEDVPAPHVNFSLRLEEASPTASTASLHTLYSGGCLVARSIDPLVIFVALLRELSVRRDARVADSSIWATVLRRRQGGAVLVSAVARRQAVYQQTRLNASGLELLATPAVELNPQSRTAVIPQPKLTADLTPILGLLGRRDEDYEPLVRQVALPLDGWVFMSLPGRLERCSRALALPQAVASLVAEEGRLRREVVGHLAEALRVTEPLGAGAFTSLDLLPALIARYGTK